MSRYLIPVKEDSKKYCKNCVYFGKTPLDSHVSSTLCMHPNADWSTVSILDGQIVPDRANIEAMRYYENDRYCGVEGRLYVPQVQPAL